jgi:hypothetical protein
MYIVNRIKIIGITYATMVFTFGIIVSILSLKMGGLNEILVEFVGLPAFIHGVLAVYFMHSILSKNKNYLGAILNYAVALVIYSICIFVYLIGAIQCVRMDLFLIVCLFAVFAIIDIFLIILNIGLKREIHTI